MIRTFGDTATEDFATGKNSARARRIPANIRRAATTKLLVLNAAVNLSDLRIPAGNRLEALRGDLSGYYSIRINQQWRIIFQWVDGGAEDVRIVDYH